MDKQEVYRRNLRYTLPTPGGFFTKINPKEEAQFYKWVKDNNVPYDRSPQADYDMVGFWKALVANDPRAVTAINPNDHRMHFPDYWKTPYHESFSAESQWATSLAPSWNELDQLVTPDGTVVFDERKKRK